MESVPLPPWLLGGWLFLSAASAWLLLRSLQKKRPALQGVRPLALPGYDLAFFACFLFSGLFLGGFWFSGLALIGVVLMWATREGLAGIRRRLGPLSVLTALGIGLAIAIAISLPLQFFSSGLGLLFQHFHLPVPLEPAVELFQSAHGSLALLGVLAAALLLAPAAEEALFRGFLQPVLKVQSKGPWPAIILSAVAFALLHGHALTFLPLCVMGLLLGLIHEWSGSLLLCIAVHFWFNLLTALMLLSSRLPS
jgi:membrane protease YdiL (CAAX protease family)